MGKDFESELNRFFEKLGNAKKMVLATSKDGRVTARMMSCVIINGMIYFQTDRTMVKYEQLSANPSVALCADNIQIEGTAKILGHPLAEGNEAFAALFQKSYKSSFDAYSHLKNEALIEVRLKKITLWEYEDGEPLRIIFDVENKAYAKEFYVGE